MAERVTGDPLLSELRERAAAELHEDILPFWERWAFDSDGWLVGSVRDDLSIDDDVPRHSVIMARILWTFAAAAGAEQDPGPAAAVRGGAGEEGEDLPAADEPPFPLRRVLLGTCGCGKRPQDPS